MKFKENNNINDLSKKFALTNEQLLEYFYLNNIDIFNENDDIDLSDKKIKNLLDRLNVTNKKNHKNKSGLNSIKIEGLFGKYNYHLDFEKDIAIWISENGVGKTSILTIIVAVLTGDVRTLYDISFKKISVNISNKIYTINKQKEILEFKGNDNSESRNRHMMYLIEDLEGYLPRNLFLKIRNEVINKGFIDLSLLDKMIYRVPYDESFNRDRIEQILQRIKDLQYSELYDVIYKIRDRLKEEIVFYPTYRRVEVGIERIFSMNLSKYRNSDLSAKYMGFGMSDVKNRIDNLLDKLRKDANAAYIKMNANIISELLEDRIGNYINDFGKIDMHKVEVVIKRIGEDRIHNIDKLKPFLTSDKFNADNSNLEFLIYYLQKLVNIYNSQEAIDKKLSKFSQVCSKYLTGKIIQYDETMLTMSIIDNDGVEIDFDNLSSGEKQIVSIFSKVYLDVTSPCIFIIDEPEISLSMEWQKEILKDIYESEKVALLIVTTHSPFIFKNEYVDFVKELEIYKEKTNVEDR